MCSLASHRAKAISALQILALQLGEHQPARSESEVPKESASTASKPTEPGQAKQASPEMQQPSQGPSQSSF